MTTLRAHLETLRRAQRAALAQARHAQDFANTHPGHQEDESACPMCAADGVPLGQLGHLVHLRCKHCGWQWSVDGREAQQ
jgi:hypothetical protein